MALSDNLQGWWCPSLDTAGNGTTTLTDLSGNGNNGTLTNMDAATDWVADTDNGGVRALDFDGINDYVRVSDPGSPSNVSVSMWVYLRSNVGRQTVADRKFADIRYVAADGNFYTAVSSVEYSFGSIVVDAWCHLVVTVEGTTLKQYLNGALVATHTSIGDSSTTEDLLFGNNFASSEAADCRLDNMALYDRVLTAAEVTQLYNGGRSFNLLPTGATIVPQLLLRRRRLFGGFII